MAEPPSMTYIPDAELTPPPLCPECGLETVWSGFDYECPVVVAYDAQWFEPDTLSEDDSEEE